MKRARLIEAPASAPSSSTTRSLLAPRSLLKLSAAVVALPLMACNYKGPAYDCEVNPDLCPDADGGTVDGGSQDDAGTDE